ncbi:MAG: LamG domain-containing protein [Thermodesulfovibrionales bacterium]|nr:LamG domain-containing protein [Thermodesulfovibrionales bacterium]
MNFNDCCPGGTCTDLSAYSNHGTISGGVACTEGVPGFTGRALYFDGSGYVNCGNKPSLNITDAITIEMWVKPNTSNGATGYLISKNNLSGGDNQYAIYTGNGRAMYVPGYSPSTAYDVIPYNVWTHLIFTRTGGIGQFYINGVASGSPAACDMPAKPTFPVRLGCRWNNGIEPIYLFNGTIDEVRIYNQALTAFEIQKHYVEGLKKHQSLVMDTDRD